MKMNFKNETISLYHPHIGEVKILKKTYLIENQEFQTRNANLVIELLLGLNFRRLQ